jgi:cytochrome c biogenesis protein ResB
MPDPEPKRFASRVEVFTDTHERYPATIEVNKPLALRGWKIYQLSYDERRGRWSQTSTVELVRDPWLPAVYTGIFMMLAGTLFTMARMRKAKP